MAAKASYADAAGAVLEDVVALGRLLEKCDGDIQGLEQPGEWRVDMPGNEAMVQAMLDEMSAGSMKTMMSEHGILETRGLRSELMGKLAAVLLPNEEWIAAKREEVRQAAIDEMIAAAIAASKAAKAAAAADLARTRAELPWMQPAQVVHAMHTYMDEPDVQDRACAALCTAPAAFR